MRFIRARQQDFINVEAIAEVSFTDPPKQHPEVEGMKTDSKHSAHTAFVKLLDGSQHALTGKVVEVLRAEVEGASVN